MLLEHTPLHLSNHRFLAARTRHTNKHIAGKTAKLAKAGGLTPGVLARF